MLANSLITDLTQFGDRMDLFGQRSQLEVSFQVNELIVSAVTSSNFLVVLYLVNFS